MCPVPKRSKRSQVTMQRQTHWLTSWKRTICQFRRKNFGPHCATVPSNDQDVRLLFIYCLDFRCAKSLATVDLLCIEKADTFRKISILTWWWWWWWWSWWWNGEARKTLRRCCAVLQCFHSHSAQDDRSWADLPQAMKREDPFAGMVRCGRKLLKQRYLETSLCECHKSLW